MNLITEEKKAMVLTGVLLLQKSYGRDEKNRLLFQCVPYDKSLPTFLVPYDVKIGFQKLVVNKYVLFSFVSWKRDIPHGILRQVLGDVCVLKAYYDYLLYSVGMFKNTSWAKQPVDLLISHNEGGGGDVETVFTIDNEGTVDYDDAFRFEVFKDGTCCVSVYITDVASLVFTQLSEDVSREAVFSGVSTLYMPHRRIPMLLDQISQQVSLVAGSLRTCVAVRFFYDFNTGQFLRGQCDKQVRVMVERNLSYFEIFETGSVSNDLYRFTRRLNSMCWGGSGSSGFAKQMVAYWMIQYNRFMVGAFSGDCFRRHHKVRGDWMCRLLEQQEYALLGSGEKLVFGYGDDEDWIGPMTNPIRRKADLYNQAIFLQVVSLGKEKGDAMACIINRQMKTTAKIQRDTQLLHYMEKRGTAEVDGVVYRIEPVIGGGCGCGGDNRYFVYLDLGGGLGMFSSYKWGECHYSDSMPFRGKFRMFYFCKNHDLKKKIRVYPISGSTGLVG